MNDAQEHSPPYLLGIDAGTEAVKAALFDAAGANVATASHAYATRFPHPGWAEQDPSDWWSGLAQAVRSCVSKSGVEPVDIAGIAAVATTCTLLPLDADGHALRPAFLWMDVRASEEARQITATGHDALRYCLAGANAEWMLPKALWFKTNEPELYAQTRYLLEYVDWITYRLTGRLTLNANTVTQRWFYHKPTGGWPFDFYAAIGLHDLAEKFPHPVVSVGEVVGGLSAEAAEALSLRAGIPVAAGGGDAFVGLLGQGVVEPGELGLITGSSNVLSALSAQEFHVPGVFGSFPDALVPGLNLVEAGQTSTGSLLSWFRRNFAQDLEAIAAGADVSIYALLDREAASTPLGSDGLIVLDYFQGNRTPHTDAMARGAVWGLSLQSSRGHLFRALMEGIAYGLRDIVETLQRRDFRAERMIASGGATHSDLFMQIYADVLGVPLHVTAEPESSLLGAAVAAAVGAGVHPDLVAASHAMTSVAGMYEPNAERHAQYAFYLRQYQETYRRLKDLMHAMHEHHA